MSRPIARLIALMAIALLVLLYSLSRPEAKPGWCVWFCGYGICPPCPGDPPPGTFAPVLVREPSRE